MKNQPDFNQFSIQEAAKLAHSEAGQQLLSSLQNAHSAEMEQAFALAAAGDYVHLKKSLEGLLSSPETKAMLDRLRG